MDFRFINKETLPQIAKLWDYCFEKKEDAFFLGISLNIV